MTAIDLNTYYNPKLTEKNVPKNVTRWDKFETVIEKFYVTFNFLRVSESTTGSEEAQQSPVNPNFLEGKQNLTYV